MSDTKVKKESKIKRAWNSWSKKKKIIVVVCSVLAFLFVAAICTGLGVLHWYCSVEDYDIVSAQEISNENTIMIAHRGFRAAAPENTLPAFEEAGEAGYTGAECDVYRTEDGVWVVQHDPITYRMMDCTKFIEKNTYEELLNYSTDNGTNIDDYSNLKICSLDEYLECCKKYNMVAVIELKGKKNTEHYDEIVSAVSKYGCDVMYISFHEENLLTMRKLTDAPMMFLSKYVDDEAIENAKSIGNCGIDFNGEKKRNFKKDGARLKKAQDEGITLAAWTIDDLETMEKLLDYGVDIITTDCITY